MYDFGSIVIERETEEHTRERRFNANAIENDHDEYGVWRVACMGFTNLYNAMLVPLVLPPLSVHNQHWGC